MAKKVQVRRAKDPDDSTEERVQPPIRWANDGRWSVGIPLFQEPDRSKEGGVVRVQMIEEEPKEPKFVRVQMIEETPKEQQIHIPIVERVVEDDC